jgi:hypothetical protein
MLRACCECVTKMLRTRLLATSNTSFPFPLPHVATILLPCCDPCCVQHPTSVTSSPFSSTQHPTPHVCNIETQRLQHWKIMFATSNNTCLQHRDSVSATLKNLDLILKHSHETLAICQEHGCNMCIMICNINEKQLYHEDDRLQHVKALLQHRYTTFDIKK